MKDKDEKSSNEKQFTFGTCEYQRSAPPREDITKETSALNIFLSFEEALKLNIAVDECVRKLNKYKRSTKDGKRAALNITVYLSQNRIAVNEGKLSK